MFRRNVGGLDRAVRLVLGVILLPAGLLLMGWNHGDGLALAVLGLAGLATGITGFCPPYLLFGISMARSRASTAAGGGKVESRIEGR